VLLRTDSGLLRTKHLVVPAAVTVAFGASTRAAIGIVVELNRQISNLEAELATHFELQPGRRHPLFPSRWTVAFWGLSNGEVAVVMLCRRQ